MTQQVICIVARQRSGTTALQANLAATGRIHNFGEIFHTDRVDKPGSFFAYCRERRILLSDVYAPRYLPTLCATYLDDLRRIAEPKHVLIDVKFNSWGIIRPAWRYLHEEPYFLQFLKKQNALFLFIRRRDLADQIVSSHIAKAHDKWQNLKADDAVETVEIDPASAAREARMVRQSEAFLWTKLRKYARRLELTYEELFVDGDLADDAKKAIGNALGEELEFPPHSPIRKSGADKAKSVKNYDEVRRAILRVTDKPAKRRTKR